MENNIEIVYNNQTLLNLRLRILEGELIMGDVVKSKMSRKIIAWLLTICLVITLIPDIGYAVGSSDSKKTKTETEQKPSKENVEKRLKILRHMILVVQHSQESRHIF